MSNGFDPDETFDEDAADRSTVRGLKIAGSASLVGVVLFICWPIVKGLIGPAIVLGACAFALWAFRNHPSALVVRGWIAMLARRAWDAVFAWLFRRGHPSTALPFRAANDNDFEPGAGWLQRDVDKAAQRSRVFPT